MDLDFYELLEQIKLRPALYLGDRKINSLHAFLNGYFLGITQNKIEIIENPDFGLLHDWVAKKYSWKESTAGWKNVILQECGNDEEKALKVFFEILEEFKDLYKHGNS